jgi:hypothetical protein
MSVQNTNDFCLENVNFILIQRLRFTTSKQKALKVASAKLKGKENSVASFLDVCQICRSKW